jgi:hypothetical protein
MQRNAAWMLVLLAGASFAVAARAQIITAQPARTFNPSPPSSATYPPAYATGLTSSLLQSPEANTIRGWYRDYLGRDAGQDVTALVNLLRGGMSSTDLQATILGSDEFYWQKGRDPQTFVRDTLQAVTWTEPSYAELQRWTDRLTQLRGDRFALAREILLSAGQSPSQASPLDDVAPRLSSAARLAVDTINFEIGGTPQGRQAGLQAQALADAASQLQQTVAAGSSRANDVGLALTSADRAYQALQTTLSNPPGTAPSAAGIVRRIGTMLTDARSAGAGGSVQPTGSYPPIGSTLPSSTGPGGYSPQPLLDQIAAARRATESLIQTLTSGAYQDYTYNVALRDLDTLASRLAGLEPLVRSGASRDRIAWEVQSVIDSGERVRSQLGTGRLPYSARLYWQSVDSNLTQLRETFGVSATAGSATMLRPTAFHESLLPLIDQAALQIDVFIAGTMPLVYGNADVPSVQADCRSLKGRVLLMRQQAGAGQAASVLKQTLNGMIGDYQDAFDRWKRIVATSRPLNPAQLSPVGETLNRVEQLINQALASGELAPTGPTRVTQDLAVLSGEVAEARRELRSLSGYREQQSIDQYLEQLAGYVVQLTDALSRQTAAEARRLAVGMQGVIGHMQTDLDSLNRSVAGLPSGGARQQAADLQYHADRIGRLVDGIEAQLY